MIFNLGYYMLYYEYNINYMTLYTYKLYIKDTYIGFKIKLCLS